MGGRQRDRLLHDSRAGHVVAGYAPAVFVLRDARLAPRRAPRRRAVWPQERRVGAARPLQAQRRAAAPPRHALPRRPRGSSGGRARRRDPPHDDADQGDGGQLRPPRPLPAGAARARPLRRARPARLGGNPLVPWWARRRTLPRAVPRHAPGADRPASQPPGGDPLGPRQRERLARRLSRVRQGGDPHLHGRAQRPRPRTGFVAPDGDPPL